MNTMLFKHIQHIYRSCSRLLLLFAACCLLPATGLAQAGSSMPIVFHSADAFYNSIALNTGTNSGLQRQAMIPRGLIQVSENTPYVFWVELERGRLKILERQSNGGYIVRQIIPVSIGSNGFDKQFEGDKKTPMGVYHFTSFLQDSQLIDFYGLGAYPMNYPNALDRLEGRTGSGIWLHGLPKHISERPLLDSDGCVVIDNDSLLQMNRYIEPGRTPVIMTAGELEWVPLEAVRNQRTSLAQSLTDWRQSWEDRDNDSYLSWYAEDFTDLSRNLGEWSEYKRRVNLQKSFIEVEFSDISFINDPRQSDVVQVRYFQQYRSSNYNWSGWKMQLWRQSGAEWEIIYEGNG